MQILGIKTSPSVIRYAVLDWNGAQATLVNAADESRLRFPAGLTSVEQKLKWLQDELETLLRLYPNIGRIAIKSNEYAPRRESGNSREAAYYDAIALLTAGRMGFPVQQYLFTSLGTRRDGVMAKAETEIGRTSVNWDEAMASATLAAFNFKD
jgi:hypothetical protein